MGGVGKGLRLSYPLGRAENCGAHGNVSCGPPLREAAARAALRAANGCWIRPRAHPPAPAYGVRCTPRTAILFGIALLALSLSSSPPAESSNELRRVAARRAGWRRTARLCEPQKFSPIHRLNPFGVRAARSGGGPKAQRAGPAVLRTTKAQPTARPSAAGKPQSVFPPEEQAQPKARPRVSLTAAPLALRRVCRRPRQFLPDWLTANRQNMPS